MDGTSFMDTGEHFAPGRKPPEPFIYEGAHDGED